MEVPAPREGDREPRVPGLPRRVGGVRAMRAAAFEAAAGHARCIQRLLAASSASACSRKDGLYLKKSLWAGDLCVIEEEWAEFLHKVRSDARLYALGHDGVKEGGVPRQRKQ